VSQLRKRTDVSFLAHAREYTAFAWNDVSAKSRISIIETLSRVVPVVTQELPGAPDAGQLRRALRKHLNPGEHAGVLDEAEVQALAWLEKASRPVMARLRPPGDCERVRWRASAAAYSSSLRRDA
jgi:hypothetical protein